MYDHTLGAAKDQLIEKLNTLEAANVHRQSKVLCYNSKAIDGLRRLVAHWNINPHLFKLAYLVAAIEFTTEKGAVEYFSHHLRSFADLNMFWQDLERVICSMPTGPYTVDNRGLSVQYGGTECFILHKWPKGERKKWDVLMLPPLLALLFETHEEVVQDCRTLGKCQTDSDVKKMATRWQNFMNQWLEAIVEGKLEKPPEEPPEKPPEEPWTKLTQHKSRQFGKMITYWMEEADSKWDGKSPLTNFIDDDQVFSFWRSHNTSESDFKLFGTVAKRAIHLWNAARMGETKRSPHLAIVAETDGEHSDEVSEDQLENQTIDTAPGPGSLLPALEAPPLDDIKFLMPREKTRVELIASQGLAAFQLPLTILRLAGFADRQRELGRAASDATKLRELLDASKPTYASWLNELRNDLKTLGDRRHACMHVLMQLHSIYAIKRLPEALSGHWEDVRSIVMEGIEPDADGMLSDPEADEHDPVAVTDTFTDNFFCKFSEIQLQCTPLLEYVGTCRNAYDQTSRKGFKDKELNQACDVRGKDAVADDYHRGDECLSGLVKVIDSFLRSLTIDKDAEALEEKFRVDQRLFRQEFTKIYLKEASHD